MRCKCSNALSRHLLIDREFNQGKKRKERRDNRSCEIREDLMFGFEGTV